MKAYKVNKQVFLGGKILGVGIYDENRILSTSIPFIESYCDEQRSLPLKERDIPPYFEVIDPDKKVETLDEKINQQLDGYVGLSKNQLLDIAKQRGIDTGKRMNKVDLINLLVESDKQQLEEDEGKRFSFKSADDFMALEVSAQLDYLDSIFGLPEDVEEDTDDEQEYIGAMSEVVAEYGGLSLDEKVTDKIKEILEWLEVEE